MTEKARKDAMYEAHPYGEQAVLDLLESAKRYANTDVLIAGCGAGNRLFYRDFGGANITAVDQSERAIEFIRSQFRELDREPPELITADLVDVDLPRNTYDHVLCYGVLHHTVAPRQILTKLGRACRDDGHLELLLYHHDSLVRLERSLVESVVNAVPVGQFLSEETKRKIEWWDKYENPLWETYTVKEAVALVEAAGLSIDDIYLTGRLFDTISRLFLPPILQSFARRHFNSFRWQIRITASPVSRDNP